MELNVRNIDIALAEHAYGVVGGVTSFDCGGALHSDVYVRNVGGSNIESIGDYGFLTIGVGDDNVVQTVWRAFEDESGHNLCAIDYLVRRGNDVGEPRSYEMDGRCTVESGTDRVVVT